MITVFTHHSLNLRKLIADDHRYQTVMTAMRGQRPEDVFQGKELAMLRYVEKLTLAVRDMTKEDIDEMVKAGCTDGENSGTQSSRWLFLLC